MARFLLVLSAIAVAVAPVPAALIERHYSRGAYPVLQRAVTTASNQVPIALLDIAAALLLLAGVFTVMRRWKRAGAGAAAMTALRGTILAAAVIYLAFAALWGLNYRRVPLETKLEYDIRRVSPDAAARFGRIAVTEVNALAGVGRGGTAEAALREAFARAQQRLAAASLAVPGRPKASVLVPYFRHAAIDGMTDPFFLEIIINSDVLPFERPFVIAHEWAHLAGYADEAEANFVAWLTCVGADDPGARYSGWLAAYHHAAGALPREDRRALNEALDPAVRRDLQAIAERLGRATPAVRNAAREAYDTYLRANRVEEGIESYGAVLRLMLGTSFENGWVPRMRSSAPSV